ncbi:MAG: UDP-N-acetylglucosamine--N-acetylmuramyl-(pentapeptide) pyrophosphoryl-undecaprenol N-acetylglucosamine transferase, partial [SAR324 cluster bacterium]|nr:UDP-N-acetylglucosamine--N-acetylmuramyl-(pentapeptide) pyrophosphoryl-undecaprenol N-acetylglucosamine transferase [SAR324 cluster bacterium]
MSAAQGGVRRVLIAGGGTGGHLFPGLAIAEALLCRHPDADIRFVGSRYGIEQRVVPERGFRLYRIPVRGLYGVSWRRRLWVIAMLPIALVRCLAVLITFRPQLVIGVGGYASGPMLACALLMRRLTVLQEQNAYPGLTNRLLGRFVRLAFVPFEGLEEFFPRRVVVGNPVRAAILALRSEPPAERPTPLLFVFGGSQGALRINEAMVAALPLLRRWGGTFSVLHQTGAADHGWVRDAYAGSGISAEALPFIEDMASAFRRCRLVLGRAGASAVTEIVAARRAALLVPIPGASGEHQLKNAQRLQAVGAGELL